jgi:hypothetical protein
VVADLKATDQNQGTKPVFKWVNPVAATTGEIFAVFKIGDSGSCQPPGASRRITNFRGAIENGIV